MKTRANSNSEPRKRKHRKWIIIASILVVLLGIRIAIPYVILHYANKKLASLNGYYGHVEDVDLNLYRGAYVVKDVFIDKVEDNKTQASTKDTSDFFSCPRIDLSVEWRAIFQKKLVGEVEFEQPVLKYIMGKNIGEGKLKEDSVSFIQLVKDFMPLQINHFAAYDAEVHYIDYNTNPTVDLPMTHVYIDGSGLTNEPDTSMLPASIKMEAALFNGKFVVNTRLDPLNDVPTFDLNAELTNTDLTEFNDFFQAYARVDVEQGTMAMYLEIAAKNGEFAGYIKPLINDLKVLSLQKGEGGPIKVVWEAIVGGVTEVFTNQPHDQFAAKVPISGRFASPDVGVGRAIVSVLENAFMHALVPAIENTINIGNVEENQEKKGILEEWFDRGKETKAKRRKEK